MRYFSYLAVAVGLQNYLFGFLSINDATTKFLLLTLPLATLFATWFAEISPLQT